MYFFYLFVVVVVVVVVVVSIALDIFRPRAQKNEDLPAMRQKRDADELAASR